MSEGTFAPSFTLLRPVSVRSLQTDLEHCSVFEVHVIVRVGESGECASSRCRCREDQDGHASLEPVHVLWHPEGRGPTESERLTWPNDAAVGHQGEAVALVTVALGKCLREHVGEHLPLGCA
eukprot:scaffold193631_cov32-Tisochrysis_lutea.AAC.1